MKGAVGHIANIVSGRFWHWNKYCSLVVEQIDLEYRTFGPNLAKQLLACLYFSVFVLRHLTGIGEPRLKVGRQAVYRVSVKELTSAQFELHLRFLIAGTAGYFCILKAEQRQVLLQVLEKSEHTEASLNFFHSIAGIDVNGLDVAFTKVCSQILKTLWNRRRAGSPHGNCPDLATLPYSLR